MGEEGDGASPSAPQTSPARRAREQRKISSAFNPRAGGQPASHGEAARKIHTRASFLHRALCNERRARLDTCTCRHSSTPRNSHAEWEKFGKEISIQALKIGLWHNRAYFFFLQELFGRRIEKAFCQCQ